MAAAWVERVRRRLEHWLRSGLRPRWVVAVSGGGDSVGLLRLLDALHADLGLELSVAHLDHGARGEAARRDAEFVAELAGSLGLPFDLGQWTPTRSAHFEADARRARYAWLAEVAQRRGAAVVAVGHTRDDQAETVLHRILRGTGPRGLAGIPGRRSLAEKVALVRPLLDIGRDEIRSYLAELGQSFHDDTTNADCSRTRARIRHELLPRLAAEYNPRIAQSLVRIGALSAAAERARRRGNRARLREALVEAVPHRIVLQRRPLARLGLFERAEVVRLAWRRAGWAERAMQAAHWEAIARVAKSGYGGVSVAGGVQASANEEHLVLLQPAEPTATIPFAAVPLPIPGEAAWAGGRVVAIAEADAPCDETVDLDALVPPLSVRAPAPGDRFNPLGMEGRTRPLSDFFRGRRVPREMRETVPLVCDERGIVWVVGHRIAERVRVREGTIRTIGLQWVAEDFGVTGERATDSKPGCD